MKNCIACGMPMTKAEDFAMEDSEKNYCKFCAKPDGSMQNYKEKLQSLTNFIINTQGLDADVAQVSAIAMMIKLPAWKKHVPLKR